MSLKRRLVRSAGVGVGATVVALVVAERLAARWLARFDFVDEGDVEQVLDDWLPRFGIYDDAL